MSYIKTKTDLGMRGIDLKKKPWRAKRRVPWAPNQDNPFRLCFKGVKEPGYKLQLRTVGRHREVAFNPKFQSVNETNLHQRDVQLIERVQNTAVL